MNYNTRNIIKTYSAITGNTDMNQIVRILSKSPVFIAVKKGNPVLMYEGYSANLFEIVDELKQQSDCPEDVRKITAENIAIVNRARRNHTGSPKRLVSMRPINAVSRRQYMQKPLPGRALRRNRRSKVAKTVNAGVKRNGIIKP